MTGDCWHAGHLYLVNTDTLSRITPDKRLEDLVAGLPGKGDHQSNYPVVGPDGKIHLGQPENAHDTGALGADALAHQWLHHFPTEHDVHGPDVVLTPGSMEAANPGR